MTIAIIGTAGRGIEVVDKPLYLKMVEKAREIISRYPSPSLISGGAAVADHVAVTIHKFDGLPLLLCLPAPWDYYEHSFLNIGHGRVANFYHKRFSSTLGSPGASLETLNTLLSQPKSNFTFKEFSSFQARNLEVAKADVVIAFTWGKTAPPPGGTAHTWAAAKGEKIHISLHDI